MLNKMPHKARVKFVRVHLIQEFGEAAVARLTPYTVDVLASCTELDTLDDPNVPNLFCKLLVATGDVYLGHEPDTYEPEEGAASGEHQLFREFRALTAEAWGCALDDVEDHDLVTHFVTAVFIAMAAQFNDPEELGTTEVIEAAIEDVVHTMATGGPFWFALEPWHRAA